VTKFSDQSASAIRDILKRYPTKQAALLPVLWVAQAQFGWISEEVMQLVAQTLDISPAHVYGVVTFYTMYQRQPVGKYHLQLCRTLSCAMMGGEALLGHLKEKLKIEEGGTTPDGKFTLSLVECLASCGTAPAMRVNETYHENLTVEKVDQVLEKLK
jgi:NADH-quinone oxidoreductase subunit E